MDWPFRAGDSAVFEALDGRRRRESLRSAEYFTYSIAITAQYERPKDCRP
jgi:hypothetical protein